jgi:hypothetical protein
VVEDRIELEDGWSASRERWAKLKREVEAEFQAFSKPSRGRIIDALAHGQRAYSLVVRLGGDSASIAAAKRIDALAEKCEIRQVE